MKEWVKTINKEIDLTEDDPDKRDEIRNLEFVET